MAEFLTVLVFVFTLGSIIIVFQSLELRRKLPSLAWVVFAVAFTAGGVRRFISLVRLPSAMVRAMAAGQIPETLTIAQWFDLALGAVYIVGIILALHLLRNDLIKIDAWDKQGQ